MRHVLTLAKLIFEQGKLVMDTACYLPIDM
jgi:hypothetical protein